MGCGDMGWGSGDWECMDRGGGGGWGVGGGEALGCMNWWVGWAVHVLGWGHGEAWGGG